MRYRTLRFCPGRRQTDWQSSRPHCSAGRMRSDPYAHAPRLPGSEEEIDPRELVGGGSVELEIGPGRGGFLFERLAASEARMIGLEIRRKWATVVNARLKERGCGQRARVFAEDARAALRRFPDACVAAVYVNFPDPWWKRRHQKRLVIAGDLIESLQRILVPGGELFVQTDVQERAQAYQSLLSATSGLEPVGQSPWADENPYGAQSTRERRAVADGLPIYRLRYRKKA